MKESFDPQGVKTQRPRTARLVGDEDSLLPELKIAVVKSSTLATAH